MNRNPKKVENSVKTSERHILGFPTEILEKIIDYLPNEDFCTVRRTCHRMYDVSKKRIKSFFINFCSFPSDLEQIFNESTYKVKELVFGERIHFETGHEEYIQFLGKHVKKIVFNCPDRILLLDGSYDDPKADIILMLLNNFHQLEIFSTKFTYFLYEAIHSLDVTVTANGAKAIEHIRTNLEATKALLPETLDPEQNIEISLDYSGVGAEDLYNQIRRLSPKLVAFSITHSPFVNLLNMNEGLNLHLNSLALEWHERCNSDNFLVPLKKFFETQKDLRVLKLNLLNTDHPHKLVNFIGSNLSKLQTLEISFIGCFTNISALKRLQELKSLSLYGGNGMLIFNKNQRTWPKVSKLELRGFHNHRELLHVVTSFFPNVRHLILDIKLNTEIRQILFKGDSFLQLTKLTLKNNYFMNSRFSAWQTRFQELCIGRDIFPPITVPATLRSLTISGSYTGEESFIKNFPHLHRLKLVITPPYLKKIGDVLLELKYLSIETGNVLDVLDVLHCSNLEVLLIKNLTTSGIKIDILDMYQKMPSLCRLELSYLRSRKRTVSSTSSAVTFVVYGIDLYDTPCCFGKFEKQIEK